MSDQPVTDATDGQAYDEDQTDPWGDGDVPATEVDDAAHDDAAHVEEDPQPQVDVPPVEAPDETGDAVIDAALADLARTVGDDLDGQVAAGQRLHQSLQGRLADLGGD